MPYDFTQNGVFSRRAVRLTERSLLLVELGAFTDRFRQIRLAQIEEVIAYRPEPRAGVLTAFALGTIGLGGLGGMLQFSIDFRGLGLFFLIIAVACAAGTTVAALRRRQRVQIVTTDGSRREVELVGRRAKREAWLERLTNHIEQVQGRAEPSTRADAEPSAAPAT